MQIVNIGSLNIDHVYRVPHVVAPGETIATQALDDFCGGKGLNQSIALARAGSQVYHGGKVGADAGMLLEMLHESGVDTRHTRVDASKPSGHAIIQVAESGQNSIVVYGGANIAMTEADVDSILDAFDAGDMLLLQNETSNVEYTMRTARKRGFTIALNPSPIGNLPRSDCVELVDILLLNEIEGFAFTGEKSPDGICLELLKRNPKLRIMLTLGDKGCRYQDAQRCIEHPIYQVDTVDTTAAGDTFTGYFLTGLRKGMPIEQILPIACKAAAICVSRHGAAPSIPLWDEVMGSGLEKADGA